jgi:hypothetical protein
MHGLGDRGASWRSVQADIGELGVPVKWQFPDAPIAAVTCNDGYEMTSWFDIEVYLSVRHKMRPDWSSWWSFAFLLHPSG